jgi:ribosomal-protein-alanine N-acetyltransferase
MVEHRLATVGDAYSLAEFYSLNKEHLGPWEPSRSSEYYTEDFWQKRLQDWEEEHLKGIAAHYLSIAPSPYRIGADCSLTNIVRGPFQACNIGYSVSQDLQGTGTMSDLLRFVIDVAFNELGLNRIMANYMPENSRSAALLERHGFQQEGLAERYLFIDGRWEDHVLTSLVNPNNL